MDSVFHRTVRLALYKGPLRLLISVQRPNLETEQEKTKFLERPKMTYGSPGKMVFFLSWRTGGDLAFPGEP